jgi:riboflavin synthase
MFTGIIEDIGTIKAKKNSRLTLATSLKDAKIGDSVAVNGVCLTVTRISDTGKYSILYFDFSPETVSKTTIGKLAVGESVNIERALKVGDRLGGHFITGHVEAVGQVISKTNKGNSLIYKISLPKHLNKYVIAKGSISIDGISLTVVEIGQNYFTVAIIPHTMKETTLKDKKNGDLVNIETDMMAKYAENIFNESSKEHLTVEKLKKSGFY